MTLHTTLTVAAQMLTGGWWLAACVVVALVVERPVRRFVVALMGGAK